MHWYQQYSSPFGPGKAVLMVWCLTASGEATYTRLGSTEMTQAWQREARRRGPLDRLVSPLALKSHCSQLATFGNWVNDWVGNWVLCSVNCATHLCIIFI